MPMEVVIAPNQKLRVKTKPVKKITPALQTTFKEMVALTKTFVDPEGVGLASTQIGEDGQYFIAKMDDNTFKMFINPKIVKVSKKVKTYLEGCLSIPKYWGETHRFFWVDAVYTNLEGQEEKTRLKGFEAWVYQHEVDHLNGKLFVDKVLEDKTRLYKVVGKDRAGAEVFEEVPL